MTDLASGVAARPLLEALVDHAALFPPAAMTMDDALAEDRRARTSPQAWMLGRFVCPASRLHELLAATAAPPPLSVVLDGELEVALAAAAAARERGATVAAVERREPDAERLRERVDAVLGAQVAVYAEGVLPAALPVRVGAKIRCGGASPADVPSVEALAAFVAGCRDRSVAFKATAGLHHPVRHRDPATGAPQHGFLNLLAAALAAEVEGAHAGALAGLLASEDAPAVLAALARFDAPSAAAVRALRFHGVGSCSWTEPVDDLRALGVL